MLTHLENGTHPTVSQDQHFSFFIDNCQFKRLAEELTKRLGQKPRSIHRYQGWRHEGPGKLSPRGPVEVDAAKRRLGVGSTFLNRQPDRRIVNRKNSNLKC
jgi:hypothetical protein